jgi:hypothetical protein
MINHPRQGPEKPAPPEEILYIYSQFTSNKNRCQIKIRKKNLAAGAVRQKYLLTNPIAVV